MARYIDENKIKFNGFTFEDADKEVYIRLSDVRQAIAQAPTEDVVEVVRCKDCKYKTFEQANNIIHCDRDRKQGTMFFKPDDFCSYGERKDT